ncbi:hypothetical protein [Lonepinella sp. BR2474]|uniref:hypothetical protein n=1 Tax=unclassified Lonepinella TaxID=2642006 RepID=UPI003F6DC70D
MKKQQRKSAEEKLDLILQMTEIINDKVDQQNQEIADLQRQIRGLQEDLKSLARRNRYQSLVAGGLGGGLVAVGFELIRLKLGG